LEGLGLVVVVIESHGLTTAQAEYHRVAPFDLDAAPSSRRRHLEEEDDLVGCVDPPLGFEPEVAPCLAPVGEPGGIALVPALDARVGDVVVVDLDVGIDQIPSRHAGSAEVLEGPADQLHVLFRHRSRSIPQLSGRAGKQIGYPLERPCQGNRTLEPLTYNSAARTPQDDADGLPSPKELSRHRH
jgi:hypothetical protein